MTPPVTPEPSDVRQKARLVRIEAHEESVAPWRPELLDAAAMLDAFADLLEARAASPSPWVDGKCSACGAPIPPPVTSAPLSEQEDRKLTELIAAVTLPSFSARDRQVAVIVARAFISQARAASPSPWQPMDTCPLDEVVCFNVVGVMRDPMSCGGRVLRTPEGHIIHGATGWRPRPQAMPKAAPPAQDAGGRTVTR